MKIHPVKVGQKITLIDFETITGALAEYQHKDVEVVITHVNESGHRFWCEFPNGYKTWKGEMNSHVITTWMYDKNNQQVQSYK